MHASAQALAESLTEAETERNLLYPDVDRIREVSIAVAVGVIQSAQKLGVDRNEELRGKGRAAIEKAVRDRMYHPLLSVEGN